MFVDAIVQLLMMLPLTAIPNIQETLNLGKLVNSGFLFIWLEKENVPDVFGVWMRRGMYFRPVKMHINAL